jgi:hypothetical protein
MVKKQLSHCGRGGTCGCRDPPQAENAASRILFYFIENFPVRRI